jgi:DNA repair protein RadC
MIKKGAKSLSNLELIAAMLGHGMEGRDIYSIAGDIAALLEKDLNNLSIQKLKGIEGVGLVRACQLVAAVEFARRFLVQDGIKIVNDKDVLKQVPELLEKKQEVFLTLTLDGANHLIQKRLLFIGTLNQSIVHPREVFTGALNDCAASIILVHNHPSGPSDPSQEDIALTKRLLAAGRLMGIDVVDHIIVGKKDHFSFQKKGLIETLV